MSMKNWLNSVEYPLLFVLNEPDNSPTDTLVGFKMSAYVIESHAVDQLV